jgi:hypothetical protein
MTLGELTVAQLKEGREVEFLQTDRSGVKVRVSKILAGGRGWSSEGAITSEQLQNAVDLELLLSIELEARVKVLDRKLAEIGRAATEHPK